MTLVGNLELYIKMNFVIYTSPLVLSLGYGMHDRRYIPGRGREGNFSFCHRVQTGSGANPTSNSLDAGGSYPESKVAGA